MSREWRALRNLDHKKRPQVDKRKGEREIERERKTTYKDFDEVSFDGVQCK